MATPACASPLRIIPEFSVRDFSDKRRRRFRGILYALVAGIDPQGELSFVLPEPLIVFNVGADDCIRNEPSFRGSVAKPLDDDCVRWA